MRVLVLHGPDEWQRQHALRELRAILDKAHGEVETFTFEGKTVALASVLDELRSYSLMQTYKLVVVDDAEQFVKTHRAALERYAQSPVDHATLVLRSANWNKGNLDKQIAKVGAVVRCDPPAPAAAARWLGQQAEQVHGCKLLPAAAQRLVDRMGTDRLKLDSALAKLALMVEPGKAIEPALVDEQVGRSSEEKAWAVQEVILDGLLAGRSGPMIEMLHELVDVAGQPQELVNWAVADLMRKLNVACMLTQGGLPESQALRQVKVFGPGVGKFTQVLRRLRPSTAGRWFDKVMRADARSKSGLGEAMRNLECFCVGLVDDVR